MNVVPWKYITQRNPSPCKEYVIRKVPRCSSLSLACQNHDKLLSYRGFVEAPESDGTGANLPLPDIF
jgi:hypothetical protein